MRVLYVPGNEKEWARYYGAQALQQGSGFVGLPYQRGSGLGSLFRGIFRTILPVAKSVGKTVGKAALSTGAQIASDVVAGKNIKEAAEERGRMAAAQLLDKAVNKLNTPTTTGKRRKKRKQQQQPQGGRGLGVRGKRKTTSGVENTIKRKKTKRTKVQDQFGIYYT